MNHKGFSLIELMVVVSIVGILSAIAAPQYQKYQRASKQTEAKTNLASLYIAEQNFYLEYASYYRNIYAAGFVPVGSLSYNITAVGGGAPFVSNELNASTYTQHNIFYDTFYICSTTFDGYIASWDPDNKVGKNCKSEAARVMPSTVDVQKTTFTVGAGGDIGGSVDDEWTINHFKELVNTVNGAL